MTKDTDTQRGRALPAERLEVYVIVLASLGQPVEVWGKIAGASGRA